MSLYMIQEGFYLQSFKDCLFALLLAAMGTLREKLVTKAGKVTVTVSYYKKVMPLLICYLIKKHQ